MSWSPRSGGLAGLSAAGLLVLSAVLYATGPDGVYRTVVLAAWVAVVAAVAGLHAAHRGRPRYGWLGTTAAAATAAGYAVMAVVSGVRMVRDPDTLQSVRITAGVLVLVGSAVLGVVVMVARLVPRWCGALLIVALPLGDVANELFPTAESLLLALLWGSVGLALLSLAPRPARIREPGSGGVVTQRSTMTG